MCGSLGHYGDRGRDQALRPVPRSLTVCAGDLCGRLAVDNCPLAGVRNRVSKSIQMQAIASEWFWSSVTTTALKKLADVLRDRQPQNLSEEFDPGSE